MWRTKMICQKQTTLKNLIVSIFFAKVLTWFADKASFFYIRRRYITYLDAEIVELIDGQ